MELLPMGAEILPPSDDRVFKLILAPEESKPILIDLLSSVLQRRVVDVAVRNSEIPPENAQEKAERLDLNCMTDDGTQVDVEMHAHHIREDPGGKNENVKGKTVYYLCDLHSSQPSKGLRRYDRLARTYQVTFCAYTVFPEREEFANSFSLRHDIDNGLLSDAIHVVFVELSKLREIMKKPVSDMTDLEKWAVFFRYADDPRYRETVNEVIASKEALKMAGDRLMSISQDERERAVMRSRRMAETDRQSDLATAWDNGVLEGMQRGRQEGIQRGRQEGIQEGMQRGRQEGIQEGMQRGRQEGIQEGMQRGRQEGIQEGMQRGRQEGMQRGRQEGRQEMARLMIANGEPEDKIMQYTGLSRDEIKKLRN